MSIHHSPIVVKHFALQAIGGNRCQQFRYPAGQKDRSRDGQHGVPDIRVLMDAIHGADGSVTPSPEGPAATITL